MKRYLILLTIGVIVVILGSYFKIMNPSSNGNTILIVGLVIEVISLFGIATWYFKNKNTPTH